MFLAMLIGVMSMFVVTLIRGIKQSAYKSEITMATDAAIRSCFAEYNERLFNEYGIMCIDTSYKLSQTSIDELSNHLSVYLEENLKNSSAYSLGDIRVREVKISNIKTINDEKDTTINKLRQNSNMQEFIINQLSEEVIEDDEVVNIVNEDIKENGSPGFDLMECITSFEASVEVYVDNGPDFSIVRSYGY